MKFDYKRLAKFELNIGAKDKKVRLYSGLALVFASLFPGSILLLVVGGILVATGYFGWCPAYSGFTHSTYTEQDALADAEAAAKKAEDHHGH
jgi:hypothetical protein